MFRNKNKKVEEIWSIDKVLKIFEGLRDNNTFLQNLLKEKQNITKKELFRNCTFKPSINDTY